MPSARPRGPDLGREEGFAAPAAGGEQLAGGRFGAAVHRRAVEHLAAGVEQRRDDAGQERVAGSSRRLVEADVGAAADDGQRLAGGRDRTRVHAAAGSRRLGERTGQAGRRRRAGRPQRAAGGLAPDRAVAQGAAANLPKDVGDAFIEIREHGADLEFTARRVRRIDDLQPRREAHRPGGERNVERDFAPRSGRDRPRRQQAHAVASQVPGLDLAGRVAEDERRRLAQRLARDDAAIAFRGYGLGAHQGRTWRI